MRAISTVLDVSLFLVLVGAAVATVAVASAPSVDGDPAGADPADETVETLSTSTVRVNYSVGPAIRSIDRDEGPPPDSPIYERSDHGTYADLLAEAAVANATIDGDRLAAVATPFAAAVTDQTEPVLRREGVGTSARAVWGPYPGAALRGTVRVGERPPRDADVHTATVTVDSGVPGARSSALAAARADGFDGVASALADSLVEGLFPLREARVAVRGDYPANEVAMARYRSSGATLGTADVDPTPRSVAEANAELHAAVSDRLEADLRKRYDDPIEAAREVDVGEVTVVVRTWSR